MQTSHSPSGTEQSYGLPPISTPSLDWEHILEVEERNWRWAVIIESQGILREMARLKNFAFVYPCWRKTYRNSFKVRSVKTVLDLSATTFKYTFQEEHNERKTSLPENI